MKTLRCLSASCLGLLLCVPFATAQRVTLLDAKFDSPNNQTFVYPHAPGTKFQEVSWLLGLSAWSVDGTIELTYGFGLGKNGTGGIHAQMLKAGKFYQINFARLKLPMLNDRYHLVGTVRSISLSLDAKLAAGKEALVYLSLNPPKDLGLSESTWATRLVLGTIRGTGDYSSYTFTGEALTEKEVDVFIKYIRTLYLNGMAESVGTLSFHFDPSVWSAGDQLQFDNVLLSIAEE